MSFGFYGGNQYINYPDFTGDGTDFDVGAEMGLLDYLWSQFWQRDVTFKNCLLSQNKNDLHFVACVQFSARLLYKGLAKKTINWFILEGGGGRIMFRLV